MKQQTPPKEDNLAAPEEGNPNPQGTLNFDTLIVALDAAVGLAWVIQQYVETTNGDCDLADALVAHATGLAQIRASVGSAIKPIVPSHLAN